MDCSEKFMLMKEERIIWKGRQSFWGSSAGILLLIGIAFILVGVSLLRDALALVLFGLSLVICGGYLFKGFRTYVITNKRLVELKAGKIVREVNLNEIVKTYGFSMLGNIIDFVSILLSGGPARGLLPILLGIDNIYVKDADGRIVFVFKRVRVKKVREKVVEALRELV